MPIIENPTKYTLNAMQAWVRKYWHYAGIPILMREQIILELIMNYLEENPFETARQARLFILKDSRTKWKKMQKKGLIKFKKDYQNNYWSYDVFAKSVLSSFISKCMRFYDKKTLKFVSLSFILSNELIALIEQDRGDISLARYMEMLIEDFDKLHKKTQLMWIKRAEKIFYANWTIESELAYVQVP